MSRIGLLRKAAAFLLQVGGISHSPFLRPMIYTDPVPNIRPCIVSFADSVGINHSVTVCGESLYETAVLALAEFRKCGFADATFGSGTHLTVAVQAPATTHEVSVGKLTAWLESGGRSPREQALKVRLRALLSA